MTDEERQRQMDFIVNQQAQFAANMQLSDERIRRLEETQQRAEEKWARTEEGIRSLLAIAEIHEREITEMKEEIRENSRIARAASEAALAASETGRNTDERLNALIIMVEKYLSERRNGKDRGN
jgi:hypothetical protein